jgi:hypothetical protein
MAEKKATILGTAGAAPKKVAAKKEEETPKTPQERIDIAKENLRKAREALSSEWRETYRELPDDMKVQRWHDYCRAASKAGITHVNRTNLDLDVIPDWYCGEPYGEER